jgi:hypothetical protein
MKRVFCGLVMGVVFGTLAVVGIALAGEVTPASLQLSCKRTTTPSGNVTNTTYWQGDYITFTNSQMFSDSSGVVTQDLEGCTITVTMGSLTTTNPTSGTTSSELYLIDDGTDGYWGGELIVPAANPCYIEVSVSNVFTFTYPRYRIATQAHLGE